MEFLWAVGKKNLADLMYSEEPENISDLRDTYIELLRQYYYVGGMPEVVQAYADNQNLQNVRHIQNRIISNYETAIEWLKDAGLIYQVTRINNFTKPLNFYEDFSAFKIYSLDLGLLGAMAQTDPADILTKNTGFVEY